MTFLQNDDLKDYWNNRYKQGEIGWDIGYPSTPLVTYAEKISNKEAAILIPGCGNGYEASAFVDAGFTNVTMLDISPVALNNLKEKLGDKVKYVEGDFFQHEGSYDYIFEQTFFCALNPALRPKYVGHMHRLLKPGGKLVGVLFNRSFEGGPPFGGNTEEYRRLFSSGWEIEKMESCYNSISPRAGTEVFIIIRKV